MSKDTINNIRCPACESNIVYRAGRARTGKQRYLCLICGMQFTNGHRTRVKNRPLCVACGSIMHLYSYELTIIRFRCSRYPDCRTYTKVPKILWGHPGRGISRPSNRQNSFGGRWSEYISVSFFLKCFRAGRGTSFGMPSLLLPNHPACTCSPFRRTPPTWPRMKEYGRIAVYFKHFFL